MPIEVYSEFDYSAVDAAMARFSRLSREAAFKAPEKTARAFIRRVVDITPPASAGRTGLAARRQGERRIDADLKGIFFPVVLRGKQPEQFPDVEGIYEQLMGYRKGGKKPRRLGKKYHVDVRKLDALRQKLYSRVGFLAGGWNAAAAAFRVSLPAWIARHGTEHGSCIVQLNADELLITITNAVKYAGDVSAYPRRVQAALDYEAAALEREVDHLLALGIARAGFESV